MKKPFNFFSVFWAAIILHPLLFATSLGNLLAQPLQPGGYALNTVPAVPAETQVQTCRLDLSDELFGGVNEACGRDLDRSRCCPVLAAWLFAAHARYALQLPSPSLSPSPSPSPSPAAASPDDSEQPMMPDDNQKCVDSLQSALLTKRVKIPQPNSTCDAISCFCGIRLHQLSSLRCPAAFNPTPTSSIKHLEKECRNSSYAGCTRCLGALQKVKGGYKKMTTERGSRMMERDCQLMGLTWLLARNKTAFIPTVSAVLRALLYTPHPPHHHSICSPDQENMPLAVDSLQFDTAVSSLVFPLLPLFISLLLSLLLWQ